VICFAVVRVSGFDPLLTVVDGGFGASKPRSLELLDVLCAIRAHST
jgi:hypothetical protein